MKPATEHRPASVVRRLIPYASRNRLLQVKATTSSAYSMWLERAMKFDEAGHVNPELCDHLALSLNLLEMLEKSRRNRFVRRSAELFFVLTFLITFGLPLFSILALVIKLESPGPILFRQLRLGLLGQPFWIYKFRTMHERAELAAAGNVIPISKSFADPRATRVERSFAVSSSMSYPSFSMW